MRSLLAALFTLGSVSFVQAQYSPAQPIQWPTTQYIYNQLFVDLTGDGQPELLICTEGDGMGYLPNLGAGEFGPMEQVDLGISDFVFAKITAGDLDGDGDNDVVFVNWTGPVLIFRNMGNADLMPEPLANPVGADAVPKLADPDGDGDIDLVLMKEYSSPAADVYMVPNDGAGGWDVPVVLTTAPEQCDQYNFADLDGDADLDLVFGDQTDYQPMISTNTGGAVFDDPQAIVQLSGSMLLDIADVDGDGDQDLLGHINEPTDDLVLLRNNGDATFISEVLLAEWAETSGHALVDLDTDGDLDLLSLSFTSGVEPQWMENDGTGAFANPHALPSGVLYPVAIDVDADGSMDLVSCDDQVKWRRNDGQGSFEELRVIVGSATNVVDLAIIDFDGDGDQDALVDKDRPYLHRNLGNGQFEDQVALDLDVESYWALYADLDADEDIDVVLETTDTVRVALNDGTGSFTWGQSLATALPIYAYEAMLADVNGDLLPDLVRHTYDSWDIRVNDGTGAFITGLSSPMAETYSEFTAADLDGDGDIDLINAGQAGLTWHANDGTGTFTVGGSIPDVSLGPPLHVLCADVDGNGALDIVFQDFINVGVIFNAGGGVFGTPQSIQPSGEFIVEMMLADAEGDGDLDLLIAESAPISVYWRINDGSGVFASTIMVSDAFDFPPEHLAVADLDNDGRNDVVVLSDDPDPFASELVGRLEWYEQFIDAPFAMEGTIYFDTDADGTHDVGEAGLPFLQPVSDPIGSNAFSDEDGAYSIAADEAGTYQVQVAAPGPLWQLSSLPVVQQPAVDAGTPISLGNDFGFAPVSMTTDLHLAADAVSAPCFGEVTHFLSVTNLGTTRPSGTICYTVDPLFTYLNSQPPPTNVTGNVLCWEYDSLNYFAQFGAAVHLVSASWTQSGASINFVLTATEEDEVGGVIQTFTSEVTGEVGCAWDPNDKHVEPEGYGDAGAVDIATEYLDYRIRFQNTGTAPAFDVVLNDRLDEAIDASSLQVIGYSHEPMSVTLEEDRKLVILFENIQLPDSGSSFSDSQGYFRFRARLMPGLPHGTQILNTASIFFDNNPAVITNTTTTTLVNCGLWTVADITEPSVQILLAPPGDSYQWFLNGEAIPGATEQAHIFMANGDYSVQVTSEFGCVGLSVVLTITTLAIEEMAGPVLAAIPNPFSDRAEVIFSETLTAEHMIQLLDVNGRIVRQFNANGGRSLIVERNELASGLYTLRIVSPDRAATMVRLVVGP